MNNIQSNNDRLKALRERAEGMGWKLKVYRDETFSIWGNEQFPNPAMIFKGGVQNEAHLDTAESLLALCDPRAVRVVDFIEEEPEFPDEMPDELLNTFKKTIGCDIQKGMAELICRVIAKVTKEAIIDRLGPAPDGYEYVVIERKVQE